MSKGNASANQLDLREARKAACSSGGLFLWDGDHRQNPGAEKIIESCYSSPVWSWRATLNYKLVMNPAYNPDRGPVKIFGVRMRAALTIAPVLICHSIQFYLRPAKMATIERHR